MLSKITQWGSIMLAFRVSLEEQKTKNKQRGHRKKSSSSLCKKGYQHNEGFHLLLGSSENQRSSM